MRKLFRVVAGTPRTVANAIEQWAEDAGTNRIIFQISRGDMPHWRVVRTLTSLAEEVIPLLKQRQKAAARGQGLAAAEAFSLPERVRLASSRLAHTATACALGSVDDERCPLVA